MPHPYGTRLPEGMALPPLHGPGNDYSFLEERIGGVVPSEPISIVIPVYNRLTMLRRTLAMLIHQTYPLELIEVVIADDGSADAPRQVLDEFSRWFDMRYVRQRDQGYRLARVRNLGTSIASHDHIIILDCDVAPVPDLVSCYAQWLTLDEKVVLIGHRRFVDANAVPWESLIESPAAMLALPDVETKNPIMRDSPTRDWREQLYARTDHLKQAPNPFGASSCGNVAFHRRIFDDAGPFDETFTAWGGEDNEFGYRAWNAGYWFIPVRDAIGLHQEPPGGKEFVDRQAGKAITFPLLREKAPPFRRYDPARRPEVPMVSIYIPAYNAAETIVAAIESALAQTYHDFEVVVCDDGSTDRTGELVRDTYRSDPRVRLVQQDNRGIGSASNMAIAAGKGPFLLHLDSDDLLEPEAIEVLLPELLEHSQRGCVYGRHYRFRDDLSDRRPSWFRPRFDRVELLHGMIVHPPRLFRKREWARLGGFSTTLSSAVDFDFFLRMSAIAELHHVDRLLYNYRIHARSTSMRYPEEQFGNARRAQAAFLSANGLSNWLPVPDEAYENPRAVTFARAVDRPSAAVAAEPSSLRPEDGAINVPNE